MNAVGVNFGEIRLSDLSPRNVVDAVNRTVNIAYDKGLRRLNDLKILYQIQSRIEEFRFEERSQAPEEKPELKSKEPAQQSSATGHLIAVRTPKNLKATL
jgi:demethoxyubiquinone hydroxylase (CLK1/Coq7/Cat5 family)